MSVLPSFSCCSQSVVVTVIIILAILHQTCSAKHRPSCPSSLCGDIRDIKYPFRLKGDPGGCGLSSYEFDCVNNRTLFTLSSGKYHVKEIDYNRYQIRLSDPGVVEDTCFLPRYFLNRSIFLHNLDPDPLTILDAYFPQVVAFLNCSNPVSGDPRYVEVKTGGCDSGGHFYAIYAGNSFNLMDVKAGCRFNVQYLTNWTHDRNVSYADILKSLEEGLWFSWLQPFCSDHCGKGIPCNLNRTTLQIECYHDHHDNICVRFNFYIHYRCGILSQIIVTIKGYILLTIHGFVNRKHFKRSLLHWNYSGVELAGEDGIPILIAARYLFGLSLLLVIFIYKWRRRHFSVYENIENFLLDNNINPIRYEYREVKKMTKGFKEKLGEGGFGSVYKGKLRSGLDVAVKMLSKSKDNGQDFVNEVATIGRIHHVNVVGLIGYCVEGKKRGLIYEYMPNGSLDKYIFSKEGSVPLSYEKIYEISLGIAHGIAYLHRGCDVQILHFDIKPHNILLDDSFTPKVSDFGLAKLYPTKDGSIFLTAIGGTLGYMAPELFYKNIGGVSYKDDIYSFGMLLMEMASKRKNSDPHADHSSQHYFPFWIHDQVKEEKDIDMEGASEMDKILMKKMFIVALWCIQCKPSDRPSMSKVVEMLEGKVESLGIPPKPSFYPQEMLEHDGTINSDETPWSDSTTSNVNVDKSISNHSSLE